MFLVVVLKALNHKFTTFDIINYSSFIILFLVLQMYLFCSFIYMVLKAVKLYNENIYAPHKY